MHQLQLFVELYNHRTVTRAAEIMGISQPTASLWLSELRKDLADPLFVRSKGQMQPTAHADDLIPAARAALDALLLVRRIGQEFVPESSTRRFRLESSDGTHVTILPRLLRILQRRAPGIRVDMATVTESPVDGLRNGRSDLVLMTMKAKLGEEFRSVPIAHEGWVSLVRTGHEIVESSEPLTTFMSGRHIVVSRNGWAESLEQNMPNGRRVVLDLPGVLALPGILVETDLIVTVPRGVGSMLAHDPRLTAIDCPVELPALGVAMYWAHRHDADLGHRWLRGALLNAARGLSTD